MASEVSDAVEGDRRLPAETMSDRDGPRLPKGRNNAFDLLRLVGALLVIVEHSWILTGHAAVLPAASGTGVGLIGVDIFFLTSGFLISASWLSDPSPGRFFARRALRIYPALFVAIAVLALLVGPLLTALPVRAYIASAETYEYLTRNLLILPLNYDLPGVYENLPYPDAVSGSLWTIRIEVLCYFGVAVLGLAGVLKRRAPLVVLAIAGLVMTTVIRLTDYHGVLIPHLLGVEAPEPITFFLLGMLARALGPRWIPPLWAPVALLVVWVAVLGTPLAHLASIVTIACTTLVVAFRAPVWLRHPTGSYDLSYGTYIIAFPVQQFLVQLGMRQPILILLAAVAAVLPLAALSWRFIERWALQHKPQSRTVPFHETDTARTRTAELLKE